MTIKWKLVNGNNLAIISKKFLPCRLVFLVYVYCHIQLLLLGHEIRETISNRIDHSTQKSSHKIHAAVVEYKDKCALQLCG